MPIIEDWDNETPGPRGSGEFRPPEERAAPTGGALLAAAARRENEVVSTAAMIAGSQEFPAEPGYSPFRDAELKSNPEFNMDPERFMHARSPAEALFIIDRMQREAEDERTIEAAGGWGTAARFALGLASPTTLLPGGAVVRGAGAAGSVARTAASVGAWAAAGAVAQEAFLQGSQVTRSKTESAASVGGALILGGLLGGGLGFMGRPRAARIAAEMDGRVTPELHVIAPGEARTNVPRAPAEAPRMSLADIDARIIPEAPAARASFAAAFSRLEDDVASSISVRSAGSADEMALVARNQGEAVSSAPLRGNGAVEPDAPYVAVYQRGSDTPDYIVANTRDAEAVSELRQHFPETKVGTPDEVARDLRGDDVIPEPRRMVDAPSPFAARASSAGAEAAAQADTTLKQGWGGKWLADKTGWTGPLLRGATSTVGAFRRATLMLADPGGLRTLANTAEGGNLAVVPGGSVGLRADTEIERLANNFSNSWDDLYFEYFKEASGGGGKAGSLINQAKRAMGREDVPMTPQEFSERAGIALRVDGGKGDKDPFIQRAIKMYQDLNKELQDKLIEVKLAKPEDFAGDPKFAAGYVTRMYNSRAIAAKADEIVDRVYQSMMRDQQQKAVLQGDAQAARDDMARITTEERKLLRRQMTTKARVMDVEARREEVDRARAQQRGRVDTWKERIDATDQEIDDLVERLDEAKSNGDYLRSDVKALEKELSVLRRTRDTMMRRAERDGPAPAPVQYDYTPPGTLPKTFNPSRFFNYLTGARGKPREFGIADWVIKNGGIRDDGGDIANAFGGKPPKGLINPKGDSYDKWAVAYAERVGRGNDDFEEVFLDHLARSAQGDTPREWRDAYDPALQQRLNEFETAEAVAREMGEAGFDVTNRSQVISFLRGEDPNAPIGRGVNDAEDPFGDMADIPIDPVQVYRGAEDFAQQVKGELRVSGRIVAAIKKKIDTREARADKNAAARAEAEVNLRASRSRMEVLLDRSELWSARAADHDSALARIAAERDTVRARMEDVIERWEGDTTKSARRATERRREQEAKRAEAIASGQYEGKNARLTGADAEVDRAVRRIVKSERTFLEPTATDYATGETRTLGRNAEIERRAKDMVNNLLSAPPGRLPYEWGETAAKEARGAMAQKNWGAGGDDPHIKMMMERRVPLQDSEMIDILENDPRAVASAAIRSTVPQVEMARMFDGDVSGSILIRQVKEEFQDLIEAAPAGKARDDLRKAQDQAIADIEGMRDRILGVHAMPENPEDLIYRAATVARQWSSIRSMGSMIYSMIPDLVGAQVRLGLGGAIEGVSRALRNIRSDAPETAIQKQFLSDMAIGTARAMTTRWANMADVMSDYGRNSRFERVMGAATQAFFSLNLSRQYDNFVRSAAGIGSLRSVMRNVEEWATKGKLDPKAAEWMAANGIGENEARRIWKAASEGRNIRDDGVLMPDGHTWEDREAYDMLRFSVRQMIDNTIIRPGQEVPFWMSTQTGRVFGQFQGFTMSAQTRILIAGLQQADANVAAGLFFYTAAGMLVTAMGDLSRDNKLKSREPGEWIAEGIDRSGVASWFMTANNMAEKMANVGLRPLMGAAPAERTVNRTMVEMLGGPTLGLAEDIRRTARAAIVTGSQALSGKPADERDDVTRGDVAAARRIIPGQNLFYLRPIFNKIQEAVEGSLGIEPRKPNEARSGADMTPYSGGETLAAAGAVAAGVGAVALGRRAAPAVRQAVGAPPKPPREFGPQQGRLVKDDAGRIVGVTGPRNNLVIRRDQQGNFAGYDEVTP